MNGRGGWKIIAAAAALALLAAPASASKDGIYGAATTTGCNCHDFGPQSVPPSPTLVKMLVDGTPVELVDGFEPGRTYELMVWVVGPAVPFAGFNLDASAGTLAPVDAAAQVINDTECGRMERVTFPRCDSTNPGPGQACEVRIDPDCPVFDPSNPDCQRCPTGSIGDRNVCRTCDDRVIVDVEATHTAPNPLPFFTVTWTAPSDGTQTVEFRLAGNSVEGAGGPTLDFWNFSDPYPIVLERLE